MDAGFCVLRGIVELAARGVFASAVIKKKGGWPSGVDGAEMDAAVAQLLHGSTRAKRGLFETKNAAGEIVRIPFLLSATKDSKYTLKQMSTYGTTNLPVGPEVRRRSVATTFRHCVVDYNYYTGRNAVDIHNNKRQHDRPLEEVMHTHAWKDRVFAHLVNTSEVNACFAFNHFVAPLEATEPLRTLRAFRAAIIDEIFQEFVTRSSAAPKHALRIIPAHSTYEHGEWQHTLSSEAPQRHCRLCSAKTRYYCICDATKSVCRCCFLTHAACV